MFFNMVPLKLFTTEFMWEPNEQSGTVTHSHFSIVMLPHIWMLTVTTFFSSYFLNCLLELHAYLPPTMIKTDISKCVQYEKKRQWRDGFSLSASIFSKKKIKMATNGSIDGTTNVI